MKKLLYLIALCPMLAFADSKVSDLVEQTSPKTTDYMYIVANSTSHKVQVGNILNLPGASTSYILSTSSGNFLTTSSATATYLQLSSATTYLQISSANATFTTLTNFNLHHTRHEDGAADEVAVTAGMMNAGSGAGATTFWRGDNTWATPASGGGSSSLAVSTGTVIVSSPTSQIDFAVPFLGTLLGASTTQISLNSSSVTLQGNTFNGANQLLRADSGGLVPNADLDNSSVTLQGNTFNGANQLMRGDASGLLPNVDIDGSSVTKYGPNIPAAAISAGSLGTSVIASSVNVNSVGLSQLSATGTPSASNFLRGDNSWASPAGSGDAVLAATQTWSGGNTLKSSTTFQGLVLISSGLLASGSTGSNGQALTSGGTGTTPTWSTVPLLASTQTWTGGNTFVSSSTFNGNINVSTGLLMSGAAGNSSTFLTSNGAGQVPTWTVPVSSFIVTFNPEQSRSTSTTAFCAISNSTNAYTSSLLCDDTADEDAGWSTILEPYRGGALKADIMFTMTSSTFGNVVDAFKVYCATVPTAIILNSITWPAANTGTIAVNSVAGAFTGATINLTTTGGVCSYGSMIMVRFSRQGSNASDTAVGDQEIKKVMVYE